MRARFFLTALAVPLVLGLIAAAGAAGADVAGGPVPTEPTSARAWVARVVAPTTRAYAAPSSSAKVRKVLPALAPLGRGPTQLLVTRTTVADGERWLEVLLPMRPNGVTGWIRADSTVLSTTSARVVIDLSEHRLTLYRANHVVLRAGIVIGKASTPTPRGTKFAIAEVISTNNPGGFLGPIVMPLTGYSETLNEFAGGNGRVAVHGTSEPGLIGTSASHGCIRMSNVNILRLARIATPGTPVSIRN